MSTGPTAPLQTVRLTLTDRELARNLFATMAEVFEQAYEPLAEDDLRRLHTREDFWALAAFMGDELVGGVTAHALSMTHTATSELFVYDLAVRRDRQRKGIGRHLIEELRRLAALNGISVLFVAADNADTHALDFYRAVGGTPTDVTHFTFS